MCVRNIVCWQCQRAVETGSESVTGCTYILFHGLFFCPFQCSRECISLLAQRLVPGNVPKSDNNIRRPEAGQNRLCR